MSYVRGQVRDESGRMIASFAQVDLLRAFEEGSGATAIAESARL